MTRQMTLGHAFRKRAEHGGSKGAGKRKTARPITTKRPMHIVMRASKARGPRSMLSPATAKAIRFRLDRDAAENGVKIRGFVNVGNHLHLIVQPQTKRGFQRFLRTFSGVVARLCTGARRGQAFGRGEGRAFWDGLAYSRVIEWGRAYENMKRYLRANEVEASHGTRARNLVNEALSRYRAKLEEAQRQAFGARSSLVSSL